jgi:hypothetical protein
MQMSDRTDPGDEADQFSSVVVRLMTPLVARTGVDAY